MILKWIFDRLVSFIGLCFLWPILLVVAILVKVKMPDGPAFLFRNELDVVVSFLIVINSAQ